jgi:hypothetical protein
MKLSSTQIKLIKEKVWGVETKIKLYKIDGKSALRGGN